MSGAATTVAESAAGFLTGRLLDRSAGGVFHATDASGSRPLTTDKRLADQADTVLALASVPGIPREHLEVALAGLHGMQDPTGRPGLVEATDRAWRALPAGRVRTVQHQLSGATALLVAAHRLDDDRMRAQAVDLLNRCLGALGPDGAPSVLDEDWRVVPAPASGLHATTTAIWALTVVDLLDESDVDCDGLPAAADRLAALVPQRARTGPPTPLARSRDVVGLALALVRAGRMLGTSRHLSAAEAALLVAVEQVHDAPGHRRTTRVQDAAELWLAGTAVAELGLDDHGAVRMAEVLIAASADARHGGFHAAARGRSAAVPRLRTEKYAQAHAALCGVTAVAAPEEEAVRT